ncbi:unnamed protein product [Rotaria magnacalcarata]|uniref:Uncharacterized protein n=1 Tax=Rotaria magnacalcarata TaxID=392030 RepID=A0A819LQ74_9BILA|nr:unnamed protein product [Rotaria magnacalcarata]CAF3965269.1 unnamed protein product [Rotaria magnacalcarata]
MRTGTYPTQPHFDNLSYISDGRDRISYLNDPYAVSSRDAVVDRNGIVLQPKELKRSRHNNNTAYNFRPGQDSIYAYSNAAFSDYSGADSRGPSIRSYIENSHNFQNPYITTKRNRTICGICSKYWYIFGLLTLIILVTIAVIIGVLVFRSKYKSRECYLLCDPGHRLVQLNSTYCECQLINECEFNPPVCGLFSCIKFNGIGYECNCTTGFRHPSTTHDLTACEDTNECENLNTCGEHQLCHNTIGNYTCSCENGFETIITPDGIACQDHDECIVPNPCSNARCINTNGSFKCVCNSGFEPELSNPLHCDDIDECLRFNPCTDHNEICENTAGSFLCSCAQGYRRNEHGNCTNINECAESTAACDINSRCEDRNGSFACCINTITDECIECGHDYLSPRSVGMSSFTFATSLTTIDLTTKMASLAISNSSSRLNAKKKSTKKIKSKKVSNPVRSKRMIDGQPVEPGRFPWIAAVLIKQQYSSSEPRYVCSATLVSSWNIITAAHCLDEQHFRKQWEITGEPSSFKDIFDIRIGVHNLSLNSTDFIQSQSYSIENFTLPSRYQSLSSESATVQEDVALIKLTKRIERSSNIDWICLPTMIHIQDQDRLKVVSYSNIDDDLIQQQLDILVLNNDENKTECQRQLGDIAEDAFCAISTNHTSILGRGDSGAGSMLFSSNSRWHLAGVMSKTGLQKSYSAMTNVSKHIEWLTSLVER